MQQISCPTCGAKTSQYVENCEYCGINLSKSSNISVDEYISAISNSISDIKNKSAVEDFIYNIPIPNGMDKQLSLFNLMNSGVTGGEFTSARYMKARGLYDSLRLASIGDYSVASYLTSFQNKYSQEAQNAAYKKLALGVGIFMVFILLVLLLTRN